MTDTPVDPFADPHAVRRYVPLYPEAVEAVQWDGSDQQAFRIVDWLDFHGVVPTLHTDQDRRIELVDPATGWVRFLRPDGWLVRNGDSFQTVSGGWFGQLYKQAHPESYSAAERGQVQGGVFAPYDDEDNRWDERQSSDGDEENR